MEDRKKKLYNALSQEYDMGDYEQFCRDIHDNDKRRKLYNATSKDYNYGSYDEFSKALGFGPKAPHADAAESHPADSGLDMLSAATEYATGYNPDINGSKKPLTDAQRTDMMYTAMRAQQAGMDAESSNLTSKLNLSKAPQIGIKDNGYTLGEDGKLKKSYTASNGTVHDNAWAANMEEARLASERTNITVAGQLRSARKKLAELEELRDNRYNEISVQLTSRSKVPSVSDIYTTRSMPDIADMDKQYRDYELAIRNTRERIKNLEEQRDNGTENHWFWRRVGRELGDVRTWDFGKGDLMDAATMLKTSQKIENGEELTPAEEEALTAMYLQSVTPGINNDWARWGSIAGASIGFVKDFALAGGGMGALSGKIASKIPAVIAKTAAKNLGKDAAESIGVKVAKEGLLNTVRSGGKDAVKKLIAEQGVGRTASIMATRALGVGVEDMLVRAPLMTATVQGMSTAADIIKTKLGDVVRDKATGELEFVNDKDWGTAAYEAAADRVIENASEMWGAHLPAVTDVTKALGARGLTAALLRTTRDNAGTVVSKTSNLLSRLGVNGIAGEVLEEYDGQAWRSALGLESAYYTDKDGNVRNNYENPEWHADIWCGIGLSVGLTGGVVMGAQYGVGKGMDGAMGLHYKHQLAKADKKASYVFDMDDWDLMRSLIDATKNKDMPTLATQIRRDRDYTNSQRKAVLDYIYRTMVCRGHNLGTYTNRRNGVAPGAEVSAVDQSYLDGYDIASRQEMVDVSNLYNLHRQRMAGLRGVNDELLDWMEQNPSDAIEMAQGNTKWSDGQKEIMFDYLNAYQVYNGMMQRISDDIDSQVEQSNAAVDSHVNHENNTVQSATLNDNRKVYIVDGYLGINDAGGVDTDQSSESFTVRDAETNKAEMVKADQILSLDEPLNPDAVKDSAANAIREEMSSKAEADIRGKAEFTPGMQFVLGDDKGNEAQVQVVANEQGVVDNGDGTINVTDGQNVMPVGVDVLQQQVDVANMNRAMQFDAERQAERAANKVASQPQPQDEQNDGYSIGQRITLSDDDNTPIEGTVVSVAPNLDPSEEQIVVEFDKPFNGKMVPALSLNEIDERILRPEPATMEEPTVENTHVLETAEPTADTSSVPMLEDGIPDYDGMEPELAWDTLLEDAEGDESIATEVVGSIVSDHKNQLKEAQAELKKAQSTTSAKKKGPALSIKERIAAAKANHEAVAAAQKKVDDAEAMLNHWMAIAGTPALRRKQEEEQKKAAEKAAEMQRKQAEKEAAAARKAEEEAKRKAEEEAARAEREALEGVPDMAEDTPSNARARGYRRVAGHKVERQQPIEAKKSKDVVIKFTDKVSQKGNVALIEAEQLQPSHNQGQRNPAFFINEAQPKDRIDQASIAASRNIASAIRPEEITSSVTAYTGAPTVNSRGEVIQGNSRGDALKQMYNEYADQADIYKQYLIDHAEDFGFSKEDITAMQHPVLVNMADVEDDAAITLGQYVAQDTESGGTERIKAKNAFSKMGEKMKNFVGILMDSSEEDSSFMQLLDKNGRRVLDWMNQNGFITPTQHKSALTDKGVLTEEAKNDLQSIMYQTVFGEDQHTETMFSAMPVKAQRAVLATAYRDNNSNEADRMMGDIRESIKAYYALSQDESFANAKNRKEARTAAADWQKQYQLDDVTGESLLNGDKFSNFAVELATMYKGESQKFIQSTFDNIYDIVQGTKESTLFEEADNTPRSLVEAIKETLNFEYDGQQGNRTLAGNHTTGQAGQQGSTGDAAAGKRVENEKRTADRGRRINADRSDSRTEEVNVTKADAPKQVKIDHQGNPLNEDGTLKIERITSVNDLTDEDFYNPTRSVQLPALPNNIDNAIGGNGKPVIIKKNIFGRNAERHNDLTPEDSRKILTSALYTPNLYGKNQKIKRPLNWVVINTKDSKGDNRLVLLEVNENKDNIEIVHWQYLRDSSLEQIKRQAVNEGGQILILPSEETEEAGGLSSLIHDLPSTDKDKTSARNSQKKKKKNEKTEAEKQLIRESAQQAIEGNRKWLEERRRILEEKVNALDAAFEEYKQSDSPTQLVIRVIDQLLSLTKGEFNVDREFASAKEKELALKRLDELYDVYVGLYKRYLSSLSLEELEAVSERLDDEKYNEVDDMDIFIYPIDESIRFKYDREKSKRLWEQKEQNEMAMKKVSHSDALQEFATAIDSGDKAKMKIASKAVVQSLIDNNVGYLYIGSMLTAVSGVKKGSKGYDRNRAQVPVLKAAKQILENLLYAKLQQAGLSGLTLDFQPDGCIIIKSEPDGAYSEFFNKLEDGEIRIYQIADDNMRGKETLPQLTSENVDLYVNKIKEKLGLNSEGANAPVGEEVAREVDKTSEPIVADGTYLKNNDAGGDAVAVVVGSAVKDGKRSYLVRFATSKEDANDKLFVGEKYFTEEELKQRLDNGVYSPAEETESNNGMPDLKTVQDISDIFDRYLGERDSLTEEDERNLWQIADELAKHYNDLTVQWLDSAGISNVEELGGYLAKRHKELHSKKGEKKASPKKEATPKEYRYRLTIRPFSIGTQPDGHLRHEDDGSPYGVVVYDHPLSRKEVENFTLVPLTEAKELEGKSYEVPFGPKTLTYRVLEVDDNGSVKFDINGEHERSLPYYKFLDEIKKGTEQKKHTARKSLRDEVDLPTEDDKIYLDNEYVDDLLGEGDSMSGKRIREHMETICARLGVQLAWVATDENANGYYESETNTIVIAADAENPLIQVFGHETIHKLKSVNMDAYNQLVSLAKDILGENFEAAVLSKERLYRKNNLSYSREYYEEEVVCDFVGEMMSNQSLLDRICWDADHKILSAIRDVIDKILAAIGFKDARLMHVRTKISAAYEMAVSRAASSSMQTAKDLKRESLRRKNEVDEKSLEYFNAHPKAMDRDTYINAQNSMDAMAGMMDPYYDATAKGLRILPEERYKTKGAASTIFTNGSYGKTMENTLKCIRTLAYNQFTDEVKKQLGRPITQKESFLASQMVYDIATDPQCLYCYVSLDRKAYDDFLLRYIQQKNDILEQFRALPKSERSAVEKGSPHTRLPELYSNLLNGRKDTPNMRRRFDMWIRNEVLGVPTITSADLATTETRLAVLNGLDESMAREIKDAEKYAQMASWAKKDVDYISYVGELLKLTPAWIKKLTGEYGLRFYSFSEYTPAFLLENMQMIRDAALRGLNGLGYTKELEFVKVFAPTGMNINCSVYGRMDKDGNMHMDTLQGADWEEVKELRNKYRNVGAVFVATTDQTVDWALEQDWIDVIIPFHIVRTGADIADFYHWDNHMRDQSDRYKEGSKTMYISPVEHENDKKKFLEACEKHNVTPRFEKWMNHPNYMRLVNETRLGVKETTPLKPVFDMDAAKDSWERFVNRGGYYNGWWNVDEQGFADAVRQVVEDIRSGKLANEVSYGRQDMPANPERMIAAARKKRIHGNIPLVDVFDRSGNVISGKRYSLRDAEDAEILKSKIAFGEMMLSDGKKKANEPMPIGRGIFGSVFDQFKGRVLQAVNFLLNHKSGDLLGVFHRKDIGDIDMVWGDDGGGLCHILNKHINDKDFLSVEELVYRIEDIINKGKVDERHSNTDKLVLVKDGYLVTIRRNLRDNGKKIADKNWILTAYKKDTPTITKAPADGTHESTAVALGTSSDAKVVTMSEINESSSENVEDKNMYREGENTEATLARTRAQMNERIHELCDRLHLDNVEVVADTALLEGKQEKAKGFYYKRTGKITIVLPNHTSVADAEQTLLHEAVAHHGLRQLFGEHFDAFLEKVYAKASEAVRRRIATLASKNGWDFHKATEEYLATLAEDTDFENFNRGWFHKIKEFFTGMLEKLGFKNLKNAAFNDNELRYILWRSYKNLSTPLSSNAPLVVAEDIAMQYGLGVGNYSPQSSAGDMLFREGDEVSPEAPSGIAIRDKYERLMRKGLFQAQEALQDSMLSLEKAMLMMSPDTKYIEDVDAHENAYLGENALSSVNQDEVRVAQRFLFKPMLQAVAEVAKNKAEREKLIDYMMAKHGLERNAYMRNRDQEKFRAEAEKKAAKKLGPKPAIEEKAEEWQDKFDHIVDKYMEKHSSKLDRDYAGLTALTGKTDVWEAEDEARQMVAEYENKHDVQKVWEAVNKVNAAILSKQFESGIIDRTTYEHISSMYRYYIPLRGFDEDVSVDKYAYLGSEEKAAFNAPIKKAKGRSSKADDPFSNMASMMESAIMQGNRNTLVKQRFLNFVLNHPSDLVSVSELWIKYDENTNEWITVFPQISDKDTPQEVVSKTEAFNDRMEQLAKQYPDLYAKVSQRPDIPYKVVSDKELHEHQIIVKRNGKDVILTVNGNPRLAQAVNGRTNPDITTKGALGSAIELVGDVNRTLSGLYTTMDINFIASNFFRDGAYSNVMAWIKEEPTYAMQYNKNFAKINPLLIINMLNKDRKGELDMNNGTDRLFAEFLRNGGETGYSRMADIETHRRYIDKALKAMNRTIPAELARENVAEVLGMVGRAVEMQSRFATYMTSRQNGRSVARSVWDAKESSVNFNKKGAGGKFWMANGQTLLGNAAAGTSAFGRTALLFWNAALQGTYGNFYKYSKRNKTKSIAALAFAFSLGLTVPMLAIMMSGGDDDDKYFDIPIHTRRQNLIIKGPGDTWLTLPLPIEVRSVYGMGELCASTLFYDRELDAMEVLSQVSQMSPVDMMSGFDANGEYDWLRPIMPGAIAPYYDVQKNVAYNGLPIYKETPFNKNMPEWTKAYGRTNKLLVSLCESLNEASGGNPYRKGEIDLNPATLDYCLSGYTGGIWKLTNQFIRLSEVAFSDREFNLRDIPVAGRFAFSAAEQANGRDLNERYYELKNEMDVFRDEYNGHKKDVNKGILDYVERLHEMQQSDTFARFYRFNKYENSIKKISKFKDMTNDEEMIEKCDNAIREIKQVMVDELHPQEVDSSK